ncbi:FAD-binding oxidoreductase [Celeribacter halophilus]|jgi:D-lactate dehydrogenase (cytochrome)|uniref:FAD-binding oxidoreductase n=1 Tax=Celeribacter halophilus TaxID=576117 RepID=UPI001C084AB8|nr:FAD-linked oxidase C-terminal domain-containing protein [Celeribacter halophilus]MBU2891010.1 FAD-binding protein [Celeribacter halophilus]MDO6511103.1 FAD-linked oxidase C-terminal domain-containing protein [Celeribacter halophilus]
MIDTAYAELSSVLEGRLTRSKSELDQHGLSETWFPPTPPEAVAYPETTAEVSEIMKICHAHGIPVTAFGAGTSLEGQTLATSGGLVVDFSRMNQVLRVNDADMDAVVQPGITREALNVELRNTGLMFPVDPGANASLGGMAMTRASGTTAVKYGTMKENVTGLEVVLADGKIIRTGSRARKSAAGYDLTSLFVGSEGTLGLITEMTVRLHGQPEAISAAVCSFEEIGPAVEAVIATIQVGLPMARIEFLDAESVHAVNLYSGANFPLKPHLFVEFHGSEATVAEQVEMFGEIVHDFGGSDFEWAAKSEDRTALWTMRHHAYWACLALRKGTKAVVTDICVPISKLAEAVEQTRADIAASPLHGPILGHVGDGNFHAILLVDPNDEAEIKEGKRLAHRMAERALALGGTITGEHGIGMGKKSLMPEEHGAAWDLMGQIKAAMDPKNILNPGKLVP